MEERTYNLRELGRAAGVTERTVRYYIKEGLLPPPSGSGPFSRYTYEHWLRLQFIKRLKDEYLPLSEIKNLLNRRSGPELAQLARQVQLIEGSGASRSGYGKSDPLLNLMRSEATPPRYRLREQMAEFSPQSGPEVENASYEVISPTVIPAYEAVPEVGRAADEDAPDADSPAGPAYSEGNLDRTEPAYSEEDFRVSETRQIQRPEAAPPALYERPGPPFQAQAFRAGSGPPGAIPPHAPAPASGGGKPNPTAPMRAMKFSAAFAPGQTPLTAGEAASGGRPVEPEPLPRPLMARAAPAPAPPPSVPAPTLQSEAGLVSGQTWERLEVAPGIELHLEKSLAETNRPALAALLQAARRLFGPKEI